MAPHRASQREVIATACRRAQVAPQHIRFVEAHGTGTPLGDQIEVLSLGDVFRDPQSVREWPLAIGAVKGAIGHTEGAAGMAGLIKTVLALRHGVVPGSPSYGEENPRLGLARLLHGTDHRAARIARRGMPGGRLQLRHGRHQRPCGPRNRPGDRGVRRSGPARGVFTLSADTPTALRRNLRLQAVDVAGRTSDDLARLCWTEQPVPGRLVLTASPPSPTAPKSCIPAVPRGAGDRISGGGWVDAPHRDTCWAEDDYIRDWELRSPTRVLANLLDALMLGEASTHVGIEGMAGPHPRIVYRRRPPATEVPLGDEASQEPELGEDLGDELAVGDDAHDRALGDDDGTGGGGGW